MGTQGPLVHIEAATLAGGDNNQDRYAYGDGWAFVLDGAPSFADVPPIHDGGWYAERLKTALVKQLTAAPQQTTESLVANAICAAAAGHDTATQGPCPTSTIALVRWTTRYVELYVLGDSFIQWSDVTTQHELRDTRLERVGCDLREAYRQRLRTGAGFDEEHRRLLRLLQRRQQEHRNSDNGFWIAGEDVGAAYRALTRRLRMSDVHAILLASDGLRTTTLQQLLSNPRNPGPTLTAILGQSHIAENQDPTGSLMPRSKVHDDKTAILITLHSNPATES